MIDKPVLFFVLLYYYYYYYLLNLSIGISDEIEVTTIAIDEKSHDCIAILPIKFDKDDDKGICQKCAIRSNCCCCCFLTSCFHLPRRFLSSSLVMLLRKKFLICDDLAEKPIDDLV